VLSYARAIFVDPAIVPTTPIFRVLSSQLVPHFDLAMSWSWTICHPQHQRRARGHRDAGARLLFLPPYSPDFNPIEMAFSKLKALLRKAAASTIDELWTVVADCSNVHNRGMPALLRSSRI
jgi:hypothetical protein